ncbi:MAG: hypothetical protein U0V72_08105 [Cytophagales bacterium]
MSNFLNVDKTKYSQWVMYAIITIPVLFLLYFYCNKGVIVTYLATQDDIATATNLYERHRYVGQNGAFVTVYAPLFACFLSLCKLLFGDIFLGFEVLSLFILWFSNYTFYKIFEKVSSFRVRLCLVLIGVFYVQHIHVHVFVLSESLFLLFFFAFVYLKFIVDDTFKHRVIFLNILMILLFFTRYASLILILGFGLMDLVVRRMTIRDLLKNYLLPFCCISIWMLICYLIIGNVTGDEFAPYKGSDWEILVRIFGFLKMFILPFGLALIFCLNIFSSKKPIFAALVIFYLIFIFYFTKTSRLELDERILVPIYIFIVLMIKEIFESISQRWVVLGTHIFLYSSVVFTLYRFIKNYLFWLSEY